MDTDFSCLVEKLENTQMATYGSENCYKAAEAIKQLTAALKLAVRLRGEWLSEYVVARDQIAALKKALCWMCDKYGGQMADGPYDPPPADIEPLIRAALAKAGL